MAGNTEATRLLCAGVHLDAVFRRRVVSELVGHAERPVAPPLGADVLPVLAHALRARREELVTALLLAAVWIGFLVTDAVMIWDALEDSRGGESGVSGGDLALLAFDPDDFVDAAFGGLFSSFGAFVPGGWAIAYAVVVLLLWLARVVSGRGTDGGVLRRVELPAPLAWLRHRVGWLVTAFVWWFAAWYAVAAIATVKDNPYPVIFPLLIAAVVWRHQFLRKRTLRSQLARQTFAEVEQPRIPRRFTRIADCIHREQNAPITLYDANRPFVGAGKPRKPWSVVLELQRAEKGTEGGVPAPRAYEPLSAREVIKMIEPRLKGLRQSAAATGVDRLRDLEIEEFVYLPAGVGRDEQLYTGQGYETAGLYDNGQVARHLERAAGEGGEARRHFLRIRVGAWNEQVVVSLLVRVHTQGGMLVLEVVPHVLGPIVPEFREVDTIVARAPEGPVRDALRACVDGPAVGVAIGIAALSALPSLVPSFRLWLAQPGASEVSEGKAPARALRSLCAWLGIGRPVQAPPDAPLVSLRQLASTDDLSLFQEMDVARYTRTLQDRIGEGVRDALRAGGFRTDRLEQNITQIHNSGVYIGEMSGGALATGSQGQATHTERSTV
ncbi:hypothetical protein ACGFSB_16775 [Streptomyces sp. NPDC048441]|uniref:hypothetical protein n=1 Tax=Streptomyces sp. NPDC048441 TaxID=3365552 RepID=UPI003721516E